MQLLLLIVISLQTSQVFASSPKCQSLFLESAKVNTLFAQDFNSEQASRLVGAQFNFSGRYKFMDPKDKRNIEGSGTVLSSIFYENGGAGNSIISIKYLSAENNILNLEFFSHDSSVIVKFEPNKNVLAFTEAAIRDNFRFLNNAAFGSRMTIENFLKQKKNQEVRFLIMNKNLNSQHQILELRSKDSKVIEEDAMAIMLGQAPIRIEIQALDGKQHTIDANRILFISYKD
jgi:hypothetical protein